MGAAVPRRRTSKVRATIEHGVRPAEGTIELVVRTIGLPRTRVKIGLANIVYSMKRAEWLVRTPEATSD
jgi:IS5 family transposase